jgi:hypothetical protein
VCLAAVDEAKQIAEEGTETGACVAFLQHRPRQLICSIYLKIMRLTPAAVLLEGRRVWGSRKFHQLVERRSTGQHASQKTMIAALPHAWQMARIPLVAAANQRC